MHGGFENRYPAASEETFCPASITYLGTTGRISEAWREVESTDVYDPVLQDRDPTALQSPLKDRFREGEIELGQISQIAEHKQIRVPIHGYSTVKTGPAESALNAIAKERRFCDSVPALSADR